MKIDKRILKFLNKFVLIYCPKCGAFMALRDNMGVAYCSKCNHRE